MKLIIKLLQETSITYDQIADFMHESFEERLQQGLRFTCSFMTAEEFERAMGPGTVFVALDEESGEMLGTVTLKIKTDRKGRTYGYHEYLAISPKAKHMGVATQLSAAWMAYAIENGVQYVKSDTATRAESSVRWHLKNGFMIYGVKAFRTTNYVSYIFIKYLGPYKKSRTFVRLHYLYSRVRYFFRFQKRRI